MFPAMSPEEPTSATDLPSAPPPCGPQIIAGYLKHLGSGPGVYRMLDGAGDVIYVGKARNLKARVAQLRAARRAHQPHRAHDLGDGVDGIRDGAHGGRGAAARSEPHQALPAALQRAAARRQVVSLHPDRARPGGAADHEASRRAQPQGRLLRAVRLGGRGRPHDQHAAAGVPAALVLRQRLREPDAALPAASDQALLGAVHGRDRAGRVRPAGGRGGALSLGRKPERAAAVPAADGGCGRRAGIRAGCEISQPAVGAGARDGRPGDQSGRDRGSRHLRRPPGGRADVRAGVLLPHRPELGQPRLLPEGRPLAAGGGGAR